MLECDEPNYFNIVESTNIFDQLIRICDEQIVLITLKQSWSVSVWSWHQPKPPSSIDERVLMYGFMLELIFFFPSFYSRILTPRNPKTGMNVKRSMTQRTRSPRTGRSQNISPTLMPRSPRIGMTIWMENGSHRRSITPNSRYLVLVSNPLCGKQYCRLRPDRRWMHIYSFIPNVDISTWNECPLFDGQSQSLVEPTGHFSHSVLCGTSYIWFTERFFRVNGSQNRFPTPPTRVNGSTQRSTIPNTVLTTSSTSTMVSVRSDSTCGRWGSYIFLFPWI